MAKLALKGIHEVTGFGTEGRKGIVDAYAWGVD